MAGSIVYSMAGSIVYSMVGSIIDDGLVFKPITTL